MSESLFINPSVDKDKQRRQYDDYHSYIPAKLEAYEIENSISLGYDVATGKFDPLNATISARNLPSGCHLWTGKTSPENRLAHLFAKELESYHNDMKAFKGISDVRLKFWSNGSNREDVCNQLNMRPNLNVLEAYFNQSKQLSLSRSGYIEPLLPPMRHPKYCQPKEKGRTKALNMEYLVHDFAFMCCQLKKESRIVLFDLGASLSFHHGKNSPILELISWYQKFGMPFDHVYAFEAAQQNPDDVYENIPENLLGSYHWYNVPISSNITSKRNPIHIMKNLHPDDLVIVKLDIDTPDVELPLTLQILNNTFDLKLIIDQFYFEHHVEMKEIARAWKDGMKGSIKESLELFQNLRKKGIASHFWV
jgi:glycerophosphoryl diester phosphodiesterase